MNKKTHFLYLSIISVLVVVCFLSFSRGKKTDVVEKHTTNTLYHTKTDTFTIMKPVYVENKTIDTVYVPTYGVDTVSLPVIQKQYTQPKMYDIWISGVEPLNLDSVSIFKDTEYITITNDIERTVYKEKWGIYGFVGLNSISRNFYPKVGVLFTAPKKWLISAEIGLYGKSVFYGVNIGYKFNN